jgi:hypothetical protein
MAQGGQPAEAEGTKVRSNMPEMNSLGQIISRTGMMENAKNAVREATRPR